MLKKLLKYDVKKYKFLFTFYILAIIFSLFARIITSSSTMPFYIAGLICGGVAIFMIISILINTLMHLWKRFEDSLYGNEAYLMHILPINKNTLYLSKTLIAFLLLVTDLLIICLSIFIISYEGGLPDNSIFASIKDIYGSNIFLLCIILLEFMNVVVCGYIGIILKHKMHKTKNSISLLIGASLYLIFHLVITLIIFSLSLMNNDIMSIFTANEINFSALRTINLIIFIINVIALLVEYFVSVLLLKKGVDVD